MKTTKGKEINSDKILVKDLFDKDRWYRIPNYQRPYVWGDDQINDLLDDIAYAAERADKAQYFLGTIVLHTKECDDDDDVTYVEHDLLDGQQRLTSLYLLMAVIRDLTDKSKRKQTCQQAIFREADPDLNIPERLRIIYDIRDEVKDFVEQFIKQQGGTDKKEELLKHTANGYDTSIKNMANALLKMRAYFEKKDAIAIDKFFPFLMNYVLLIYVASEELEDAFRMFTILNDRGVKLRNSDILKASNLKAFKDAGGKESKVQEYAKLWEDIENELGEDFDLFLSYLRTILVKEKARLSLLREFEENIYNPTKFDYSTKKSYTVPALLNKGADTFEYLKKYKKHYNELFSNNNHHLNNTWEFDNLINIMQDTIPSDLWVPPLLAYKEYFGDMRLLEFLKKLDNKFSGDWITQKTPTFRIEQMNEIIKKIELVGKSDKEQTEKLDELYSSDIFDFEKEDFFKILSDNNIYGRRYAKYMLYKLDMIYGNNDIKKEPLKTITVEHILPQTPHDNSRWKVDWTDDEREQWTHKLGNLVLLSRRKNSSQGRLDYVEKKQRYFQNNIDSFSNSLRVLNTFSTWKLEDLETNHNKVIEDLKAYYN